jgi:hypothetical protein
VAYKPLPQLFLHLAEAVPGIGLPDILQGQKGAHGKRHENNDKYPGKFHLLSKRKLKFICARSPWI